MHYASIHFFHTLGTMHEISVGEGSNMTNITKKKEENKEIYIYINFLKGKNNILIYFF